jgi:hypothetical protein
MPAFKLNAITPKHLPTTKEYMQAMEKATRKVAALAMRDMQSTTRTWDHKPDFDVTVTRTGNDFVVVAGTDDKIYGFVDAGTRPHEIKAKRSKYLAFQSGYRAKTRVGIIGSNEGGAFGDTEFRKSVKHSGFPGRKFILRIQRRRQVTMRQEVGQAIALVNRTQK